jgi:endogenous inhibitor of DNA gyrase (YacG/DUF329 family)
METNMSAKYSVPPFSGKNYAKNSQAAPEGTSPCAICGKPVSIERHVKLGRPFAVVVDGGAEWGDESSPVDGGHMGGWPIGNDCHRKYVVRPQEGDAECTNCGARFWSGDGHKNAPLCPRCK